MNNPKHEKQTVGNPAVCRICGRDLVPDECALTRKLINRGAVEFMCLSCLSEHFGVSENVLREKIRQFRDMGCTLFR
ncbi:MAG: hypothetical protein IJL36_01885 [Clostridia bacterium]|nr:hypothetical protein [Clostridia bacterium]